MRASRRLAWLPVLAALLAPVTAAAQDTAPLKKVVVTLPFEEAELIVKAEAQRQNLNLIYEVDAGHTALVSARQSWSLEALPDHRPGPAALAAARQLERMIDEMFDAVVEESKARGK